MRKTYWMLIPAIASHENVGTVSTGWVRDRSRATGSIRPRTRAVSTPRPSAAKTA